MIHPLIQTRIDALASELAELVKLSVVQAVEEVLDVRPAAPPTKRARRARVLARAEIKPAARPTPTRASAVTKPVSFDLYERLAYQRAIAESGGNVIAAQKLLGLSKSTMYRRMKDLGMPRHGPGDTEIPFVTEDPVSLVGYERIALQRALNETDHDMLRTAKLLGVGRSTLYRKMAEHGIPRQERRSSKEIGDLSDRLLDYVIQHPEQRGKQIAAALRTDAQTVHYSMRNLIADGNVGTKGISSGTAYSPV